jgi:hypothetical protein
MGFRKFQPLTDGLPYLNGSFKFRVGPINCSVLCGGISYTALDYFETGIKPPRSGKTPSDGNPMEEYLYRRQMTAHFYTWHRFAAAWTQGIPILGFFLRPLVHAVEQDSIDDLAKYLATRPVILCLYGGVGHGHHVIAVDCNPGAKTIYLYDSNHPRQRSVLRQLSDSRWHSDWLHETSGEHWRGWFMDWGHYSDGARVPPLAFRHCRTCHRPNTSSLGVEGECVGGSHDNHPDIEYFLPWQQGEGQGGWRLCGRCLCPYRQTGSDTPLCPAGGLHFPQQHNRCWQELHVLTTGQGDAGWRRCATCTSLFEPGGRTTGKCAAGP